MKHILDNPMGEYAQIAKDLEKPSVKMDMLARYAQGQNPAVPEFLALAEIKRRQSLMAHSPQPSPTTVREDLIRASMPQQPVGLPSMPIPQGVAALPSGISEQAYAGGGIVAFSGANGKSDVEEDPEGLGYFERFKRYVNNLGGGVAPRQGAAVNATPSEIEGARTGRTPSANMLSADADNQAGGFYGGKKPTAEQFEVAHPNVSWSGTPAPESKNTRPKASDAAKELGITQVDPQADMFGKYEKMFNEQAAAAKAQREQDKWMRLLEAGLGIMGGTSQHALVNIGQGAMGAAKGYAQDKAAAQKEERQNVMDLMNLGMKKEEAKMKAEELAMQKKYYGSHGNLYEAQADFYRSGKGAANSTAMDKARLAAVTSRYNAWSRLNPYASPEEQNAKMAEIERQVGMPGSASAGPAVMGSYSLKGGYTPTGS